MKRILSKVWICAGVMLAAFIVGNTFAVYEPQSPVGWLRFQALYGASSDKTAFLDEYRANLWEENGGYIPGQVEEFLIGGLESSANEREVAAIVRFYSRQAGGREGTFVTRLTDGGRRKVAQAVLRDWKTYPSSAKEGGFVLLEGLRQNTYLGKSSLVVPNSKWPLSSAQLAPVAALLDRWNQKYASVPFTKRPDPLAGTPYSVVAP